MDRLRWACAVRCVLACISIRFGSRRPFTRGNGASRCYRASAAASVCVGVQRGLTPAASCTHSPRRPSLLVRAEQTDDRPAASLRNSGVVAENDFTNSPRFFASPAPADARPAEPSPASLRVRGQSLVGAMLLLPEPTSPAEADEPADPLAAVRMHRSQCARSAAAARVSPQGSACAAEAVAVADAFRANDVLRVEHMRSVRVDARIDGIPLLPKREQLLSPKPAPTTATPPPPPPAPAPVLAFSARLSPLDPVALDGTTVGAQASAHNRALAEPARVRQRVLLQKQAVPLPVYLDEPPHSMSMQCTASACRCAKWDLLGS